MKTTIELPDDLLERARSMAREQKTTLRSLIEQGLRHVLSRRTDATDRFVLRDASVPGDGVHDDVDEGNWSALSDLIYRGRGS